MKIGFLDSFTGVFSDLGACHRAGALLALEDANRRGRVKYEFAFGDDASKPAIATSEARRLVTQEKADVLFGGVSSANGLALSPLALDLGIFNLEIGPQDSLDHRRQGRQAHLSVRAQRAHADRAGDAPRAGAGQKWYFIQADYALGRDGYAQLSEALKRAGGSEVGHDVVPLGTADFSSVLTKLRNSGADVLILANSGLDAANTAKQFVDFGLNKKMKLAGIALEDIYYKAIPLDAIAGATFPVIWTPSVSGSAKKLAARLARGIRGPISSRHYLGYEALTTLVDRIEAAGTTDAAKLAAAFDNHSFDVAKGSRATWRACDHQAIQDTYAGAVVSSKTFARTQVMYDVVGEVPAQESDGNCDSPWAKDATSAMAGQKIAAREGYTPKRV